MIYIDLTLKLNSCDLLFLKVFWLYSEITESIPLFTEKMKTKVCSRKFVDEETSDSKNYSRTPKKPTKS